MWGRRCPKPKPKPKPNPNPKPKPKPSPNPSPNSNHTKDLLTLEVHIASLSHRLAPELRAPH